MFLKKTPKPKGTYLAITESYYDKEKKATRQKTIMGLGYLEELRKEFPDPIAHFEKVVADMNQEREVKKNSVVYVDLTAALSPGEHTLRNAGYGILKHIYKELQLDIFWRTKTWNLSLSYNIEEIFRLLIISQILYPQLPWKDAISQVPYFEKLTSFQEEDLLKALQLIQKYQRDIQKWLYDHSANMFSRDYTRIHHEQKDYIFSRQTGSTSVGKSVSRQSVSAIHMEFLTDQQGIPIAYDLSIRGTMLNQSVSNAARRISRDYLKGLAPEEFIFRQSEGDAASEFHAYMEAALAIKKSSLPAASSEELDQAISAQVIISFTAFTILRILEAKLDFAFSEEQITSSLLNYNCMQIAGNIYQFTYYDSLLAACEASLGVELHNKYRSQLQIRRLLRY